MTFFLKLFGMLFAGLASHILYGPTETIGGRTGLLSKYAVGTMALIFGATLIVDELDINDCRKKQIIANLLAAGGVGTGVAIGHLFDWMSGK